MSYDYISGAEIDDPTREKYVSRQNKDRTSIAIELEQLKSGDTLTVVLTGFAAEKGEKLAVQMQHMLAAKGLAMSINAVPGDTVDRVVLKTLAGADIQSIEQAVTALASTDIPIPKTGGKEKYQPVISTENANAIIKQERTRIREKFSSARAAGSSVLAANGR